MRIKQISINNFRSMTKAKIEFPQVPILVIYDINGSGKTSLQEAIIFSIKGEIDWYTQGDYGTIDALFPIRGNPKSRINTSLILEDNDRSIQYNANRPKRKKTYLTKSAKFDISFNINGEKCKKEDIKEISESMLNIDYENFPISNFLSQNIVNDMLVSDPKIRGKVFNKILSSDWISDIIGSINLSVSNSRKRKREMQIQFEKLNMKLKNTDLDSLFNQLQANIKDLEAEGLVFKTKNKIQPLDLHERIFASTELLQIDYSYKADQKITKSTFSIIKQIKKRKQEMEIQLEKNKEFIENAEEKMESLQKEKLALDELSAKKGDLAEKRKNEKDAYEKIKNLPKSKKESLEKLKNELDIIDKKIKEYNNLSKRIDKEENRNKIEIKKSEIEKEYNELKIELSAKSKIHSSAIETNGKLKELDHIRNVNINKENSILSKYQPETLKKSLYSIVSHFSNFNPKELNFPVDEIIEVHSLLKEGTDLQTTEEKLGILIPKLEKIDLTSKIDDITKYLSISKGIPGLRDQIKEKKQLLVPVNIDIETSEKIIEDNKTVKQNLPGDKSNITIASILVFFLLALFGIKIPIFFVLLIPSILGVLIFLNIIPKDNLSVFYNFVPLSKRQIEFDEIINNEENRLKDYQERKKNIMEQIEFYEESINQLSIDTINPFIQELDDPEKFLAQINLTNRNLEKIDNFMQLHQFNVEMKNIKHDILMNDNKIANVIKKFIDDNKIEVEIKNISSLIKYINSLDIETKKGEERKNSLYSEIESLNIKIEAIKDLVERRDKILTLNDTKQSFEDLKAQHKKLKSLVKKIEKEFNDLIEKVELQKEKYNELEIQYSKIQNQSEEKAKYIKTIKNDLKITQEDQNLDTLKESLIKNKLAEIEIQTNQKEKLDNLLPEIDKLSDYFKNYNLLAKSWKKHKTSVEKIENQIDSIDTVTNKINEYVDAIKLIQIAFQEENENYLKKFEKQIFNDLNKYFNSLGGHEQLDDIDFSFKFLRNSLSANLNVGIGGSKGGPKALYSNGQQVSLVISLFMATSKANLADSNLKWIGFDEPTQYLDSYRKENFVKTLQQFYNDVGNAQIIISTADKEFIDIISENENFKIMNFKQLLEFKGDSYIKPMNPLNITPGGGSKNKPDEDRPLIPSFGSTPPKRAESPSKLPEGKEYECKICKKKFLSVTRKFICDNDNCIEEYNRRMFE